MSRIKQWIVSIVATVASTYALDALATVAGVLLVASALLTGLDHGWLIVVLVASYAAWGVGLGVNLRANSRLLAATGTSTNVLSKAAYDLTRRRTRNPRAAKIAAAVGYTGTEIAKEVPYYAGAFGAALFTDSVGADEAVIFLIGANLGAALYEYGVARLTVVFLHRRRGSASFDRAREDSVRTRVTGPDRSDGRPGGRFVTAALRRYRRHTVAGHAHPGTGADEHGPVQARRPAAHGHSSINGGRARRRVRRSKAPGPALVGAEMSVPLVAGGERRYVNLDYAASAPCLIAVRQAVDELLPWYSSVHRGAGYKSQLTTEAYEDARAAVGGFVGGRGDDVVVFTRNTTDSINLLASALPAGTEVIAFAAEHHANLLPWRRRSHTLLPLPAGAPDAVDRLERALSGRDPRRPCLVAVTGASNVTGEIWPYAEMARLAHGHGARLLLDAAQLAPHRRIDMAADGVDYLALSGHKLYAPFGAGALIGRPDWLGAGEPFLAGGGAVRYVGTDSVLWADLPDRQEAGSPNVVGAVALGAACRTLRATDRDRLEAHEARLIEHLRDRLAAVPGVETYRLWEPDHPRIGVLPFALHGVPYALLAAVLSAEYGIGVRHGCFCAHPLMTRLLKVGKAGEARIRDALGRGADVPIPGAVRASIGIGTTVADCDLLVAAVADIAAHGPRWTYASTADGTDCRPVPDPRRSPAGTVTRPAAR